MIRYLIVDDEFMAHDIIKGYCDLLPDFKLMKNCYDALEAIEYLNENQVELIFLDLNMPKLKGFEFLRTLSAPPKIIVTTAYKEFALEGYELNILDYLLKPFSFERFLKAVNKVTSESSITPSKVQDQTGPHSIFLKSDKKHIQVAIEEILFIEAAGNYVKVVRSESNITVREKISTLLDMLPQKQFLQVHKSFVVAKKHVGAIEGNSILIDQHRIPIGKVYKKNVEDFLRS